MTEQIATVLSGVMVVVIGLIIEYKTGFFQKQIKRSRPVAPSSVAKNQRPPKEDDGKDWGIAVANARSTFAKMRSVPLENVHIRDWSVNWRKTEARVTLKFPDRAYVDPITKSYAIRWATIIVDPKGRILKEE